MPVIILLVSTKDGAYTINRCVDLFADLNGDLYQTLSALLYYYAFNFAASD